MSRDYCFSCGGCGGKCDKCSAQCCINNMNSHYEIYDLSNQFEKKVNSSLNDDISEKANEIRNYLNNNCGFYISYYYGEDFLSKLKNKKQELNRNVSDLNNEINVEENNHSSKMKEFSSKHETNIKNMNQKFQEEKNKYIYKKDDKLIKDKKDTIKNLNDEKNSIDSNKNTIIANYIRDERKKADNNFNNRKTEIERQYIVNKEKDLKYNEEENNLKAEYSKNILKIKNIADKIPYYNNFIIQTGLNKYLN